MNTLARLAKKVVLCHPSVASAFYAVLTAKRARQAAAQGGPFGQSAEDHWFLSRLKHARVPWASSGCYIDIGANHPVVLSATYLLYLQGWQGLTVEPIPSLARLHRSMRPRDICLNTGVASVRGQLPFWETAPDYFSSFSRQAAAEAEASGWCRIIRECLIDVRPPAEIINSLPAGRQVNYLSIDTEGLDVEILTHWPWEQSRPDVISCEAATQGERRAEVEELLTAAGYAPVKQFTVTAFWAGPDLAAQLR